MDRAPEPPDAPSTAQMGLPRGACLLAVLFLAVVACGGLVAIVALRPAPRGIADRLLDLPDTPSGESVSWTTDDPADAARWLGGQIGAQVPAIDLVEAGATTVGAQAFPALARGALHFENRKGVLVTLHIFRQPRVRIERLPERTYETRRFHVGRTTHPSLNLAAWRAGDLTLVAASPIALDDLLPIADEMARQWDLRSAPAHNRAR